MPRPGPRPYECVRRAWHSDRQRPVRGSIIQQIFRIVNEVHPHATRKNKEWQEKLPLVVLKAEEIIYSKANSEVEYTNLETLWDRLKDAINTIIRRDEINETGESLPPCIEAALNLGCIPVTASRTQRHNHYLSPNLNFSRPESSNSAVEIGQNRNFIAHCLGPFSLNSQPADPDPNFGSVFPLYYGKISRDEEHELSRRVSEEMILFGRPINPTAEEATKKNLFSSSSGAELV